MDQSESEARNREIDMISQLSSILGALLVLIAYFAQQIGGLKREALSYLWLNLIGAAFLLAAALFTAQYGFIFLQAAWLLITVQGFWRRA